MRRAEPAAAKNTFKIPAATPTPIFHRYQFYQPSASNSASDPQAVPAAPDPDLTFAELIERLVRRALATTRSTSRSGGGEVRIELTDIVLPETTLSLRHSAQGWHLLGVTGNRQSLERLDRFAPALVRRFAAASLGQLEAVTQLASLEPTRPALPGL